MKTRFSFIGWGTMALLAAFCSQEARAALPPTDPGPAPEIVDIEVLGAFKVWRPFASNLNVLRYKVWVVARVTAVKDTATGLKQGSTITLHYDAHDYTCPFLCGPGSYPIPSRGEHYRANLIADGLGYSPWGTPTDIPLLAVSEK
jgi:hypothetical protein